MTDDVKKQDEKKEPPKDEKKDEEKKTDDKKPEDKDKEEKGCKKLSPELEARFVAMEKTIADLADSVKKGQSQPKELTAQEHIAEAIKKGAVIPGFAMGRSPGQPPEGDPLTKGGRTAVQGNAAKAAAKWRNGGS